MSYFSMGYGMIPTSSADPAEVRRAVDEAVDTKMSAAEADGKADDVRTFASFDVFPRTGVSGVEYVDESTGSEYVWDGSGYVLLNEPETLSSTDIDNLGNWD